MDNRYRLGFWLVLGVLTAARLCVIGGFGLSTDESHYVMYARHPAWGYYDHPPMVAFMIALTTVPGRGPFFVRLGPVLCSVLVLILLRRLALALYGDERVAFWAAVTANLMPYHHALAVAALPDATLNLFWCAALLAGWHAVSRGRWRAWLLSGLAFGGALLSKYHGVLLPACVLGFLFSSPRRRRWLLRPHPYVSLLVGLLVFLPNVVWNWRHDWISYAYQWAHGGGRGEFRVVNVLEVVGGQLAAASPLVFVLLVAGAVIRLRHRPLGEADSYVLWMSVPVFVFFCGIGTFGKILPHWPFIGWWPLLLQGVAAALKGLAAPESARQWRRWCAAGAAVSVVMIAFAYAAVFRPVVGGLHNRLRAASLALHARWPSIAPLAEFKSKYDITNDLYGWGEAATRVRALRDAMPAPERTFVFCHRFFAASQLAVYLDPEVEVTSLHRLPNQYRLWFKPETRVGWDALFVDVDHSFQGPARYAALFREVASEPVRINVLRDGQVAHEVRVYPCYGFAGKWQGE
ncbi:MAG: glycosyltransferase family 39 protein [Kiritimatiellae bacterium]|nr:glycosyltransferase family 39 protein [Kiritimatiellia bacterium]